MTNAVQYDFKIWTHLVLVIYSINTQEECKCFLFICRAYYNLSWHHYLCLFEYLHKRSNEGYSSFNLSHAKPTKKVSISTFDLSRDILNKIPGNVNLFSYDIGDGVEWLDVQSLAYLDRNKDIIEKILFQMHSVSGD